MLVLFFFFKQKTAYEMRISDWSSDVCSSDLAAQGLRRRDQGARLPRARRSSCQKAPLPLQSEAKRQLSVIGSVRCAAAERPHHLHSSAPPGDLDIEIGLLRIERCCLRRHHVAIVRRAVTIAFERQPLGPGRRPRGAVPFVFLPPPRGRIP